MRATTRFLLTVSMSFFAGLLAMWLHATYTRLESDSKPPANAKTISEVRSQDGRFVAAVVAADLDGMGATISQPYQLWLTSAEGESRLMIEADKASGLRASWRSPLQLEVCYADAQILQFRNRFFSISRSGALPSGTALEVTLRRVPKWSDCQD